VTPKGGPTKKKAVPGGHGNTAPSPSTRYTPPVPNAVKESPPWLPFVMFGLFAIGMIVIFLHYVDLFLPGASSNWWLFAGLAAILGGIITATQYH